MEIRTGRYTNFALTVIAVLLAGLLFQVSVGLVTTAHAQRLEGIRPGDTEQNVQQARTQAQINAQSDPAVAQGLQAIASAIREVGSALTQVAQSNQQIANAIRDMELPAPAAP